MNGHAVGTGNSYHSTGVVVPYRFLWRRGVSLTASEARARLFPLIQQVNHDHEPVEITSRGGNAILMSADDFRSWQETVYLLRSPANAAQLMAAVAADKAAAPRWSPEAWRSWRHWCRTASEGPVVSSHRLGGPSVLAGR